MIQIYFGIPLEAYVRGSNVTFIDKFRLPNAHVIRRTRTFQLPSKAKRGFAKMLSAKVHGRAPLPTPIRSRMMVPFHCVFPFLFSLLFSLLVPQQDQGHHSSAVSHVRARLGRGDERQHAQQKKEDGFIAVHQNGAWNGYGLMDRKVEARRALEQQQRQDELQGLRETVGQTLTRRQMRELAARRASGRGARAHNAEEPRTKKQKICLTTLFERGDQRIKNSGQNRDKRSWPIVTTRT